MIRQLQVVLVLLTTISGCTKQAAVPAATGNKTTIIKMTTDSLTYLALGDSYTIGEAVPQSESFPYQLTTTLTSASIPVSHPTIIATTGWTTDNLINAIANSAINGKTYDFVTLLIGVNDQFQGLSQSNYQVKFMQVLQTAINFAKGDTSRVFVLSIPDYGVTPFAGGNDNVIGPQIDQFNAINKAESLKTGVHYLDITGISRRAATDPSLIATDGLHPSAKMYDLWVQQIEPVVAAKLKK